MWKIGIINQEFRNQDWKLSRWGLIQMVIKDICSMNFISQLPSSSTNLQF